MEDDIEITEKAISEYKLGDSHDNIIIESSEDNRRFALELVLQATKTIDIYTQDLAARIYDEPEFIAALRELATANKRAMIRVLVNAPDKAIKTGHRIIELARRLTSSIELRHIAADFRSDAQSYLIADGRGVFHRKNAARYEANVNFNNPMQARELTNHFNSTWEHSPLVAEFKRLYI